MKKQSLPHKKYTASLFVNKVQKLMGNINVFSRQKSEIFSITACGTILITML
jgi:hypothetical protein